jgi:hypothetical protein
VSMKKQERPTLSPEDVTFWRTEIKAARQKRKEIETTYGWDENLKRYVPAPMDAQGKVKADVNTGADFRDVERKKAALFYDTPDTSLVVKQDRQIEPKDKQEAAAITGLPKPLMLSTLVSWQQEILNYMLGPQHANVKPTVLKAIFDCLCPAGVGPVSVGYQVTMTTVKKSVPVTDAVGNPIMQPVPALEQAGAMMGLIAPPMPTPMTQVIDVEVPIYERWFVSRFSPKALLVPASFRDTDFQRSPWLGKEFRKPTSQVMREYNLPADWKGTASDDAEKPYFENDATEVTEEDAGDPYVTGVELYYRKQLRSKEEEHPEALMHLVFVDGKEDTPLIHRDSPHQDFNDLGELSPSSLKGFCDRPLTLRDLSDSAWIPSDCSVTGPLTLEGNKYRSQIIEQRDGNKMVIAYDGDAIDPTASDKIKNSGGVKWVHLKGGALAGGKDTIMVQVAQPTLGRETYAGMDVIDSDREKILGIAANQTGAQSKQRKTATEQTIVQRNSEARFEQERQRVLEWFINDIVQPFDCLILRYADARVAVQILGEARGQLWAQFKDHLWGGYAYELRVDSGKYIDVEADRRQALQFYNIVRKDPFVNPRPILNELASKFGYDPAEFVVEPPKPEKEMKASISFKATEDFNPMNPAFAINIALARQAGWVIDEAAIQLAQQQALGQNGGLIPVSGVGPDPNPNRQKPPQGHPGAMEKAPTINQHVNDESGSQSGPKIAGGSVM